MYGEYGVLDLSDNYGLIAPESLDDYGDFGALPPPPAVAKARARAKRRRLNRARRWAKRRVHTAYGRKMKRWAKSYLKAYKAEKKRSQMASYYRDNPALLPGVAAGNMMHQGAPDRTAIAPMAARKLGRPRAQTATHNKLIAMWTGIPQDASDKKIAPVIESSYSPAAYAQRKGWRPGINASYPATKGALLGRKHPMAKAVPMGVRVKMGAPK
jgi:hypothetical protein